VKNIGRWRDLLGAGVTTAGSTDFPWGVPILGPVLRTLYTATTRIGPNGEPPTPWMSMQTITTYQAIELLTRGSAWALREENLKGSLRPGLLADLVVFSRDPLAVKPQRLLDLDVAMTMVGGTVEYLNPEHADLST
jgi:predicted amidohydrolase YtcJ